MVHEHEVRDKAGSFLRRDISLASFERWLQRHSHQMFQDSPSEAIELVAAINLLISEYYDHVIDEESLRSALYDLMPQAGILHLHIDIKMHVSFEPPAMSSTTSDSLGWISQQV